MAQELGERGQDRLHDVSDHPPARPGDRHLMRGLDRTSATSLVCQETDPRGYNQRDGLCGTTGSSQADFGKTPRPLEDVKARTHCRMSGSEYTERWHRSRPTGTPAGGTRHRCPTRSTSEPYSFTSHSSEEFVNYISKLHLVKLDHTNVIAMVID